jgi:hypothetical protein
MSEDQLSIARHYLDVLCSSVTRDDAALFDPSGTSGDRSSAGLGPESHRKGKKCNTESTRSLSGETDTTSLSNGLSSLELHSTADPRPAWDGIETLDKVVELDLDDKIVRLTELFPSQNLDEILSTLQEECNGDFVQALDILLNQSFFNEAFAIDKELAVPAKGIDGFALDDVAVRRKKKKGKNRKYKGLDDASSMTETDTAPNKWQVANADITLIASLAKLPATTISTLYHKNGASKNKTILALMDQKAAEKTNPFSEDPSLNMNAIKLSNDFPTISLDRSALIVQLTQPSMSDAHELARLLTTSPGSYTGPTRIIPQYAPIRLDSHFPSVSSVAPPTRTHVGNSASLAAARATAFMKASEYYRKSRSDHLMSAAAAHYSSKGRDLHAALKITSAAEADALVAAQSTSTKLDLHGISVKDAIRIAHERVRDWWYNLGENRVKGSMYTIISGMGRHSDGGVAKIGPAVTKVLIKEGWKVEVGSGVLIVTGVAKQS